MTIEQLHKTKLSEHSNKALGSEANSSRSHSSSHLHPDSASHSPSWTSRLESFSQQLRQFQAVPETPKLQVPGNVIAGQTVNTQTSKNKHSSTKSSLSSHENLGKKSKPLGRTAQKSRTIGLRADTHRVGVSNALSNETGVSHLDLNSVAEDFDSSVSSDVLTEADSVLLNEMTPTSSLVLDEHDVMEDGSEISVDAHYDIVGSRATLPKTVDIGLTPTRKKSKKKKKQEEEMSTDSKRVRSKGMPVWSKDDLKRPESLKNILDRIAVLLRPDKKAMIEKAKELEVEAKETMYLEELSSYVDLCIQTNMVRK